MIFYSIGLLRQLTSSLCGYACRTKLKVHMGLLMISHRNLNPPKLLGDHRLANMTGLITLNSIKLTHLAAMTQLACLRVHLWNSTIRSSHCWSPVYHFIQTCSRSIQVDYNVNHAFKMSRCAPAFSNLTDYCIEGNKGLFLFQHTRAQIRYRV